MLIREKDKQSLEAIFATVQLPFAVWAYGSRVDGSAHSGSNLNLAIRTPDHTPLPLSVYNSLCEKIRDSNIPILVELRDWAMLPASFHAGIVKQYEVLYDSIGKVNGVLH